MVQLKDCPAISRRLNKTVGTTGIDESALATGQNERQRTWFRWQEVIDNELADWAANPGQLEDDGLTAPSIQIIRLASEIAALCRDSGWVPPLRVVPNGAGGVVFERRDGAIFETLEIRADGSVEQATYENSRLRARRRPLF